LIDCNHCCCLSQINIHKQTARQWRLICATHFICHPTRVTVVSTFYVILSTPCLKKQAKLFLL